jgi:hypothetical protein
MRHREHEMTIRTTSAMSPEDATQGHTTIRDFTPQNQNMRYADKTRMKRV